MAPKVISQGRFAIFQKNEVEGVLETEWRVSFPFLNNNPDVAIAPRIFYRMCEHWLEVAKAITFSFTESQN